MLALEVLFELIKNNADITGITIFFAYDSTFFLNDLLSVKNLIDTFNVYSLFSGLKANFSKCEIARIGSLKGVLEAICNLRQSVCSNNRHYQHFRCSFFILWLSQSTKTFSRYSKNHTSALFLEQQNALVRGKYNYL